MNSPVAEVLLRIDAPGFDDNELEEMTKLLRWEIENLDIESATPMVKGPAPDGAMGVDLIKLGSLSIKLATSLLSPLTAVIKDFLDRRGAGSIEKSTQKTTTIQLGYGKFFISIGRSTTTKELIIKTDQLRSQIETETGKPA